MAEIITRTFELSLGHRFRLYAEWMAGRARREAEAARVAPATVVAAKGRAVRAEAGAPVSERARPAAAPSLFRALRPGDRIVKPPSLTATMPTSTTTQSPLTEGPASRMIPHEPEPVAAILDRRQTAVARMATWLRGDPGARPSAADPVASVPAAHTMQPAAPEAPVGPSVDVEGDIVDWLSISELNGLAPGAGYWLSVPEMTTPIAAKLAGVTKTKAKAALDGAVRVALLWQIATEEEEALGPADAISIRHGRIPLTALSRPKRVGERAREKRAPTGAPTL